MNKMLENYFMMKEAKEKNEEKAIKARVLISEGLYEKVWSEREQMYEKIPIEVTDEEYMKIAEYAKKKPADYIENAVARVVKNSSIILFILNFICSIFLSAITIDSYGLDLDFDEFNWAVFLTLVLVSFLGCLLMYAVGEIINKLDRIEKKSSDI